MTDIRARLRSKSPYLSGSSAERTMEEADAEIERLQAHSKSMIDALNADIDAKHAEIERLRAALRGLMLDHEWKSIDKDNMEYQVRVNCYTRNKLLAALEPKP